MDAVKVLVCGGREFSDEAAVFRALDGVRAKHGCVAVVNGHCPTGADKFARAWAAKHAQPLINVPAHWDTLGKQAGPMRNAWMLEYTKPDAVIAFPGGNGTAGMIKLAEDADIPVWQPVGIGEA